LSSKTQGWIGEPLATAENGFSARIIGTDLGTEQGSGGEEGIINIIAKNAPRGAFGDNIYVVNDVYLTINMLSAAQQRPV